VSALIWIALGLVAWAVLWIVRKKPTSALRIETLGRYLVAHLGDQWDYVSPGHFLEPRLALCESRLRRRTQRIARADEQLSRFDG